MEWPIFAVDLLRSPAEDWEGLPSFDGRSGVAGTAATAAKAEDDKKSAALLAALEEVFVSARGNEDRAQALETMQTFLSVRRVRLMEDMLMLSLALGEGGDVGSGVGNGESSFYSDPASLARSQQPPFAAAAAPEPTAGSQSLDALRREISLARRSLPMASTGSTTGQRRGEQQQQRGPRPLLVFREGSAAERELARAAGGATAEFDSVGRQGHALSRGVVDLFFRAWADRCGRLTVPLKQTVDGDSSRGGGGGASGKDDREIQAARDIERDMLKINGVLVVGREGYATVVGRVKRELERLADPITGSEDPDAAVTGAAAPSGRPLTQNSLLRPSNQLEGFSKLVLKAANRTESGGLSFDAIHRIMSLCPEACDGSVLVVPDSSKAEPLGINIAAEGFKSTGDTPFGPLDRFPEMREGVHSFGVCARIEAVTVYSLYSADMEKVYLKLRTTFRNRVLLPLSPFSSSSCEAFSDVGYRGEAGEVEIEVVQGSHAT